AVGPHDDEIRLLGVRRADDAEDLVLEVRRPLARGAEADHVGLRRIFAVADRPSVNEFPLRILRLEVGAELLELLLREITPVGLALADELLAELLIDVPALALEVGALRSGHLGPLVPVEPEPAEGVEDRPDALEARPRLV